MSYTIRLRRDTSTNWSSTNPVLALGEAGYDRTNNKLKIGDNTTPWNSLPYLTADVSLSNGDKGDITVSNGGTTWTIDNSAVSYAKIQNVSATDRILGRFSSGAGIIEEITCTSFARSLLDDTDAATVRSTLGLGTLSLQNANAIAVTGGTLENVTATTGTYSSPVNQAVLIVARKASAGTITKGQIVYITGSSGTHMLVELARADTEATSAYTIGVAATDITNTADGFIMQQGRLTGLNTLPAGTYNNGDTIYLSETTFGGYRKTLPIAPNHGVFIGFVVRSNNGGAGELDVRIQNYQELEELSDVDINELTLANNDLLQYKSATGTWRNISVSDILNAITDVTLTTNNQLRFTYANNTTESFNFGSLAFLNGSLGSNGQVLFNNAGSIAGDSGLTYDPATDTLTIGTAGSGRIVMGNGEFISNSVNGIIEIGPNGIHPESPSKDFYSITIDGTQWGFGVRLGAKNTRTGLSAGGIWFDADLTLGNGKDFNLDTGGWYKLTTQTNAGKTCATLGIMGGGQVSGQSAGSFVLCINNEKTAANRIPTVAHDDPTLYIYARGSANANDFIRMNHNTTDGTIETGHGKLLLKAASNVRIQGSAGSFDLPAGDGTPNQVIATNGSGVSSWTTLGSLAFQSGTFSGTSSGINTGDQNVFTTIAVAGQPNVDADSASDTLTLVAGSGISLTTNATTDIITITNTGVNEGFVIAMSIAL